MRRHSANFATTFPRAFWTAATFLFAPLWVPAALPDDHRVDRVSVFERGIYQASSGSSPIAESSFGSVTKVRDVSLVQGTTTFRRASRCDLDCGTSSTALPPEHLWTLGL